MNAPAPNLHELATAWRIARDNEMQANAERLQIEAAILALMPSKLEGTVTDQSTGVTATYRVTRKADTARLQAEWAALDPAVQGAFRWKADVDARALRALDDELMRKAQDYFTTTPAKPGISIKDPT